MRAMPITDMVQQRFAFVLTDVAALYDSWKAIPASLSEKY